MILTVLWVWIEGISVSQLDTLVKTSSEYFFHKSTVVLNICKQQLRANRDALFTIQNKTSPVQGKVVTFHVLKIKDSCQNKFLRQILFLIIMIAEILAKLDIFFII